MKYRKEIDGLRALAVIPVILFHAGSQIFTGGYLGVDIFFVISGYLISSIILADLAKGAFSFKKFYERRARRILPALSLVMLSCIPLAWLWMTPIQFEKFTNSIISTSLFVSNILFWSESGYFKESTEIKPLIHTWSLSIEEQFYLLFPILLLLLWKSQKNRLILIFSSIAICSIIGAQFASKYTDFNFYLLPTRIWELLVGAILALLQQKYNKQVNVNFSRFMPILGLSMILISMLTFNKHTDHPSLLTLIPVCGTAFIIFFAGKDDFVTKLLSNKLLVGVGLISYSLYLWHQPLFAFTRIFSINNKLPSTTYAALIAVTFVLAFLSWKFVEQPFRNRNLIVSKQAWQFAGATLIFFISFGSISTALNGIPARFDSSLLDMIDYHKSNPHIQFSQDNKKCLGRKVSQACILGAKDSSPTYALVGDSHAGILAMHLDSTLKRNNKSGIELANSGCPYSQDLTRKGYNCDEINGSVKERLMDNDISTVIISGRYVRQMEGIPFDNKEGGIERTKKKSLKYVPIGDYDIDEAARYKKVAAGYRSAIDSLLENGKKIVLVYPIPEVGWHVPRTLFKHKVIKGENKQISTSHNLYFERSKKVINIFNSIKDTHNLIRVYPDQIFCNSFIKGRCAANHKDKIFYFDDDHLSLEGSKLLVQKISAAIKEKWGEL